MSIYNISKVSRNDYIKDIITSSEYEIINSNNEFLEIKNSIMCLADSKTIDSWEEWFELPLQPTWTLADRVERLVYTFNSRGFFTTNFLKKQAMVFTNGEIDVIEDFANYHFVIQFTNMLGVPPNIENFREMVNVNKPAHLTYEIKYRYRTWGEVKDFTWAEIAQYTWEEARSKEGILNGTYY